jgi:hypothetical protein
MTAKDSNNGRRESLGFAEAVAQYIAPLLTAKGFTRTEQTAYSVRFQSPAVALAVFHEPVSYELDLVYALQAAPSERYNLCDMLDTVLGIGHKEQAFFQASEHDRVVYCIKAIADYLRKYGDKVLIGDPTVYQRMREVTRRRNEAYTKQVVQQPIRQAAEDAWQKHDYAKVRDLYEPIEDDLTPVEKKRLDYAKSHSRSG